jgi:hypothetical protein
MLLPESVKKWADKHAELILILQHADRNYDELTKLSLQCMVGIKLFILHQGNPTLNSFGANTISALCNFTLKSKIMTKPILPCQLLDTYLAYSSALKMDVVKVLRNVCKLVPGYTA